MQLTPIPEKHFSVSLLKYGKKDSLLNVGGATVELRSWLNNFTHPRILNTQIVGSADFVNGIE